MIRKYLSRDHKSLRKHLLTDQDVFKDPHYKKFLYLQNKEIVGWIVVEKSHDRLIIEWIFIHEEFRNKQIGSQLIKKAIS